MKKLVLMCLLHPIAGVLIWLDLSRRSDIIGAKKVLWPVCVLIPLIPFLYVLTGDELW